MSEGSVDKTYGVSIASKAYHSLADIPSDNVLLRIMKMIRSLTMFPEIGQPYDPIYDAARPPVECRVIYVDHYGIYYHFDRDEDLSTILFVIDERMDPNARFTVTTRF